MHLQQSVIRVTENLKQVLKALQNEACLADRASDSVQLLAVSKRHPLAAIRAAFAAGQRDFGENFVDEGIAKIEAFKPEGIVWHYIGAIQSNKTRDIATYFDWVHTIDRAKIARRLSEQRSSDRPPLQVCLQVNIDNETQKAGTSIADTAELAAYVATLPNLRLRGLMCLPQAQDLHDAQRAPFRRLRELLEQLQPRHPAMDTLSMGMSQDLAAAVQEGATIVRVGTAIFGQRPTA